MRKVTRGFAVVAVFLAISGVSKAQWGDAATTPVYVAPPGPYNKVDGKTVPFANTYTTGANGPWIIGGGSTFSYSATDGSNHSVTMSGGSTNITNGG